MASDSVLPIGSELIRKMTRDSRVAALRWDLVPWGLVLDLDTPLAEGEGVPSRRVWLLFSGLSDITWPLIDARVPTGCWLGSDVIESVFEGEREYRFKALLPRFRGNDMEPNPTQTVVIKGQALCGVMSARTALLGECPPSWQDRTTLASDAEMLEELMTVLEGQAKERGPSR